MPFTSLTMLKLLELARARHFPAEVCIGKASGVLKLCSFARGR